MKKAINRYYLYHYSFIAIVVSIAVGAIACALISPSVGANFNFLLVGSAITSTVFGAAVFLIKKELISEEFVDVGDEVVKNKRDVFKEILQKEKKYKVLQFNEDYHRVLLSSDGLLMEVSLEEIINDYRKINEIVK